jgi:hypothetical protein
MMTGHLSSALSSLAVLGGLALGFYARFRYIKAEPGESPFSGIRWQVVPGRDQFRPPGFWVFLTGFLLSTLGAIGLTLQVIR